MAADPTPMTGPRLRGGVMAVLATLGLAAIAASPASAAKLPSPRPVAFALSPVAPTSALRLRGTRGQVLHGAILVRNVSGRPVTVILQAADIQNASNGNADYVTAPLSLTGRWLHLTTGRVRLAPRTGRQVRFTVDVPARAGGASHYAGIVAINAADLARTTARGTAKGRTFTFHRIDRQALPVTIRLPGRLSRHLALRSARIVVQPVGAGLVLGLLPRGTELIESARIKLHVLRGDHTIFSYVSTVGQLFPDAPLDYRIPWKGQPTPGSYHVLGVIYPQGTAAVKINRAVELTAAKGTQLKHATAPTAQPVTSSLPGWVWIVLAADAAVLITLSVAVWKLAHRPSRAVA
jgi:hypothetical protein